MVLYLAGEAEKDYWSSIRGIQEKNKDNRNYKGRYSFVPLIIFGFICFTKNNPPCAFVLYFLLVKAGFNQMVIIL
jgi:hypothetical protein